MRAPDRGIRHVAVPSRNGMRWLVHLDRAMSAAYAASVAPIVPAVEAGLSLNVVANRVTGVVSQPSTILLEPWRDARDRFLQLTSELAVRSEAALVADVRACYASIGHRVVGRSLERLGCGQGSVESVVRGLHRFEAAGIRGLPVGPSPSAVLANAVLSHLDRAVTVAGHPHVRWVDDVIVFLRRREDAAAVLELLRETLSAVGLELAAEKTRIVLRPAGRSRTLLGRPSRMGDAPSDSEG